MTYQRPSSLGAICEHGSLARSCETCDHLEAMSAKDAEIVRLKASIDRCDQALKLKEQLNQTLRDEVSELKGWVADLQSGMFVNCVYCGHRYGPRDETPVWMADVLKEHVEKCPRHPMSELRVKLSHAQRKAAAFDLIAGKDFIVKPVLCADGWQTEWAVSKQPEFEWHRSPDLLTAIEAANQPAPEVRQ